MTDRVWAESETQLDHRGLISQWVCLCLSFFVILSLAGFFLFPSGKINNFPTYLTGLLALVCIGLNTEVLRWVWKSRIFQASLGFVTYLTISAFWTTQVQTDDLLTTFGAWALLVTMLVAIAICARRLSNFVDLLVGLVVVAATGSAAHFLITSSGHAWGRLDTPTVACLVYGLASVFAVCRAISATSWGERLLWAVCVPVLLGACYVLGAGYVPFGILTAAVVVCALYAWRYRSSGRFYILAPLLMALMALQLASFYDVLDSKRDVIWKPVVNMVYADSPIFGSGLLAEARPGLACSAAEDVPIETSDCLIQHPHNVYIATMYFGGVVGLALLLLLVLTALAYTIEAPFEKHKPLILASLAYAFSVLIFDGDRLVQKVDFIWLVFWLPVALAIVLNLRARELDDLEEP